MKNKIRKITRTWTTKGGEIRTKTYEYDYKHKSTRGLTLVGKNGAVNKKNIEKYKNQIKKDENLTDSEKRRIMVDIDAYVFQRKGEKKKLTTTGFEGHLKSDSVDRMLTNAGVTFEDAAEELGIDASELSDSKRWKGSQFTNSKGETYELSFTYTGDIWQRVSG